MSHFLCIVIGEDHKNQLQPFHEYECTGTNDEYVQDIDKTAEVRELMTRTDEPLSLSDALDYYGLAGLVVDDESHVQKDGEGAHRWGYAVVKDGELIKAIDRTNPNKKWDWWQVGGRWTGFFKLKDGTAGELGDRSMLDTSEDTREAERLADIASKGDVDFAAMRDKAGAEAGIQWDACRAIVGDQTWEPWDAVYVRLNSDSEAARNAYWSQPSIVALKQADSMKYGFHLDDALSGPREAFVMAARNRAAIPFAIVHKGEWSERGAMGWWGMHRDDVDFDTWSRLVSELFDSLPDDTLLTAVDCHI